EFSEGEDPRKAVGKAITAAEAGTGILDLTVLHEGKSKPVQIKLPVLGAYSPTWPFDCKKSQTILDRACAYVAGRSTPDRGVSGHREFDGLLLLASGKVEYLDIVRRTVYRIMDDPLTGGYQGWSRGFAGILLGEYYLATGDVALLPKLEAVADATAKGQMKCGSWGHRMPWDGYGAVNQIGLLCDISLALAKEAGATVDDAAIQRSVDFYVKYAGKGWVPYGDHVPYMGKSAAGKNGSAAIFFDILGVHPKAVKDFVAPIAASYDYREVGHTGAYFSYMWGPPGAIRGDRKAFQKFADEQKWYYDLARTHEGGITCQPNPENLSGRTPGSYTQWGAPRTTGTMAMMYMLATRNLRVTGGPKTVFSNPKAKGMSLWQARKWSEAAAANKAFAPAAERMQQTIALTLKAVEANIATGDVLLASEQLKALTRLVGRETPKMAAVAKALATPVALRQLEVGKEYYQAKPRYRRENRSWGRMNNLAKRKDSFYGREAAKAMEGLTAPASRPKWERLLPLDATEPQTWRFFGWNDKGEPEGWTEPDFEDLLWPETVGPFLPKKSKEAEWKKEWVGARSTFTLAKTPTGKLGIVVECTVGTEVYLNGYRILEVVSTPRRPEEVLPLHDKAITLLKKGANTLAVRSKKGRNGTVNVSLRIAK
ncbi:hypothetical protein HQ560_12355, partial [bacterium]|nr:hypothetical protein [bacterium]